MSCNRVVAAVVAVLVFGMGFRAVNRETVSLTSAADDTGDAVDFSQRIQKAVDAGKGEIRFPKGRYRFSKTVVIDLDRVGPTSIVGDGTATIVMDGPGPAFRFVGTHGGTASPKTVKPNVWSRQRTPMVDGIEIVGGHPQACGIEAQGTMQLTVTRTVVRDALHGIHLIKRNRNVILSECHLYDNRGIGVYLDRLNLHQINIANCHISYNDGGGVVSRGSEIRNLQIGACDIEGNMGSPDSPPTANVLLDSAGGSVAEVAIVGCTIQHSHDAPRSANIRFNGKGTERPHTEELRQGHITIADNVLSDVQVNIELTDVRGATITGNTMWKGYSHNLLIDRCENVAISGNMLENNPRYHYGDGKEAKLAVEILNSNGVTLTGNHHSGTHNIEASVTVKNCRHVNLTGCTVLDFAKHAIALDNVSESRVSDCLIRSDRSSSNPRILVRGGEGNSIDPELVK